MGGQATCDSHHALQHAHPQALQSAAGCTRKLLQMQKHCLCNTVVADEQVVSYGTKVGKL